MRKRIRKKPILLFHWSPVERRTAILKRGLRVGSRTVQHSVKMPHICFSESPSMAWALSADAMNEPGEWDLWMRWSTCTDQPISRRSDLGPVSEYRIYTDIPKSKIWHVGTRAMKPWRSARRRKPVNGKTKRR